MQKRQLILFVILMIISFLLLAFASLTRLEHWNIGFFYLLSGMAILIFSAAIYYIVKIARK